MTVRVGRSINSTSALTPSSYGRSGFVNAQIDKYAAVAAQRNLEALNADGMDLHIWTKSRTGEACTCSRGSRLGGAIPAPIVPLPVNGDAPSTKSDLDLAGEQSPIPSRSGDFGSRATDAPLKFKVFEVQDESTETIYNKELGGNIVVPDTESGRVSHMDAVDAALEDLETGPSDESAVVTLDDVPLFGGPDKDLCGICMGTGFREGYRLLNGQRLVCDALYDIPGTVLTGFTVERGIYPWTFKAGVNTNNTVSFFLELPKYFINAFSPRVMNNTFPALGLSLKARVKGSGSSFSPLTVDYLNTMQGVGAILEIQVACIDDDFQGTVEFTHVEFIVQFAKWPRGQQPPFSRDINFELFEALINSQIEMGADVPQLDRETVIAESRSKSIWRVNTATVKSTERGIILGNEADVRLIQPTENLRLLNMINDQYVRILTPSVLHKREFIPGGLPPRYSAMDDIVRLVVSNLPQNITPNIYNLAVQKGETFAHSFTYTDANGKAVDITGYSIELTVWDEYNGSTQIVQFSTAGGGIVLTAPTSGTFQLSISSGATTSSLTAGIYFYELILTSPAPASTKLLTGTFNLYA